MSKDIQKTFKRPGDVAFATQEVPQPARAAEIPAFQELGRTIGLCA
jgi:hypothetical protein